MGDRFSSRLSKFSKLLRHTFFGLLLFSSCQNPENSDHESKSFEWQLSTPEKEGISVDKLDSLIKNIEAGQYGNIDELLIVKNGKLIYDEQYVHDYKVISKGENGKMGCGYQTCLDTSRIHIYNYFHPNYHPYYKESGLHTIQSITKSIASTIIGCSIQQAKIEDVGQSIYPFFQDQVFQNDSILAHFKKSTIHDVLTMQLGLEWKELGLTLEMNSSVSEMETSEDWIRYILNQPIAYPPGEKWNYSSGASQLLSKIILSQTGKTIDKYSEEVLFNKLNIDNYYWKKTPKGLPDTESGLYLRASDLGKIGLLFLQDGVWNGERILPENWVRLASTKHVTDIYGDGGSEGYGYQWWLTGDQSSMIVGLGYGNQILVIIPDQDVVAVALAWNVFDDPSDYIFGDLVDIFVP